MGDKPESIKTKHRYFTEVTYFPPPDDYVPSGEHLMRAEVNVVINDHYACKGFHIFEGEKGLWVGMPADENKQGDYYDRFFPITKEGREHIYAVILGNFPKSSVSKLSPADIRNRAKQTSQSGGSDWSASSAGGGGWGGSGDSGGDTSQESSGWGSSGTSTPSESQDNNSNNGWGAEPDSSNSSPQENTQQNSDSKSAQEAAGKKNEDSNASADNWGTAPSNVSNNEAQDKPQKPSPVSNSTPTPNQSNSPTLILKLVENAGVQLLVGLVVIIILVGAISGGTVYFLLRDTSEPQPQTVDRVAMNPVEREPEERPRQESPREPEPMNEPEPKVEPEPVQEAPAVMVGNININTATAGQLQQLPRIGPTTADNIISYRENNGSFSSVDELTNVTRIGPATLETIKNSTGTRTESVSNEVDPGAGININTASSSELQQLPRIGPATAGNIISYREENGSFGSVDELTNVTRIGPATLAGLRDRVTVEE